MCDGIKTRASSSHLLQRFSSFFLEAKHINFLYFLNISIEMSWLTGQVLPGGLTFSPVACRSERQASPEVGSDVFASCVEITIGNWAFCKMRPSIFKTKAQLCQSKLIRKGAEFFGWPILLILQNPQSSENLHSKVLQWRNLALLSM